MVYSGPFAFRTEQLVNLVLQSHRQISDLLPPLMQPKLEDGLIFSFDDALTPAVRQDAVLPWFILPVEWNYLTIVYSVEEVDTVLETLAQVALILEESTTSDIDISRKLGIVSQTVSRFNETQLHQIWERVELPQNATVRLNLLNSCIFRIGGLPQSFSQQQGLVCRLRRGQWKPNGIRFSIGFD